VDVGGAEAPLVGRDGPRTYAWQPLSAGAAVGPGGDDTWVEPCPNGPPPAARPTAATASRPGMNGRDGAGHAAEGNDPAGAAGGAAAAGGVGLAALIREAEALRGALGDARARAARLAAALRRHSHRERLVSATLASLRQLELQEVGE
jgi:hypothetical protein